MKAPGEKYTNYGFTLLELMVVVAIIGIVAAIAFRPITNFVNNWRVRSAAVELSGYLRAARQTALKDEGGCVIAIDAAGNVQPVGGSTCASQLPPANVGREGNAIGLNVAGPSTVTFNALGLTAAASEYILTTTAFGGGNTQLCVRVHPPLGIVRVGFGPVGGACAYSLSA